MSALANKVRVRVVMPYEGGFLMEVLDDPNGVLCGKKRFPGGGIEDKETPRDAAIREMKEEFGVDIDRRDLKYVGSTWFETFQSYEDVFVWKTHRMGPGAHSGTVGTVTTLIVGRPTDPDFAGGDVSDMLLS